MDWSRLPYKQLLLSGAVLLITCLILGTGDRLPGTGAGDVTSVIIQADDLSEARMAVEAAGGRGVRELGIINAVGANLTAGQVGQVAAQDGVRVFANSTVVVSSATTDTVRDEFSVRGYANNDGTQSWSSDWVEVGDDWRSARASHGAGQHGRPASRPSSV